MKENIVDRIFRDKLSSILLIVTFAICIFAVYNFSDLIGRYIMQEKDVNKYKNKFSGNIEYNVNPDSDGNWIIEGEIKIDKSDIWQIIKGMELSKGERKKIETFTFTYDGYTRINLVFDFSNEYLEDIESYYDKRKVVPGVYISKAMLKYIICEDNNNYVKVNNNKYLVKGVYKDYTLDHDDYRIVIPWKVLNKNEKNYYVDFFVDKIKSLQNVGIDIESNGNVTEDIQFIKKFTEKNNLLIAGEIWKYDNSSLLMQSLILIIMITFSVINAFTVTGMWIVRRREELMIKKAWGMSEGMIYIRTFLELSRHLIASIPVMIIFQLVYMIIFKETVTFNLYKYAYLFFGLIIILSLVSYAALLRIRKLKPAEGLRGE